MTSEITGAQDAQTFVFPGLPVADAGPLTSHPSAEQSEVVMAGSNCDACVDPTIAKQMDQNFVNFGAQLNSSAIRHNSTAEFISEQSKSGYLLERQLVGAKAAGQLDRDALAKSRLDVASVDGPKVV